MSTFQVIHAPVTGNTAALTLRDVCQHFGRTAEIALDEALECSGIEVPTSVKAQLITALMAGTIQAKSGVAFAARRLTDPGDDR